MAKATKKPVSDRGVKWIAKIDAAIAREDTWRKQGAKVVQRYRDERDKAALVNSSKINILWANTEVLKSALYARTAKPDVRRRFPDAKAGNSASRVAAEVLERSVSYVLDTEDVDGALIPAVEDMLLPGRGTVWVSYEPEIEEPEDEDDGSGDDVSGDGAESRGVSSGAEGAGGVATPVSGGDGAYATGGESVSVGGRLVAQKLCLEYVYWEDYAEGKARQDKHVPWKARRHALSKEEFEVKFPDAQEVRGGSQGGGYKLKSLSDGDPQGDDDLVECWEIWVIGGRTRIWVARGYSDILEENPDPYELSTFYPTPRPLRSVTTTDTQTPRAEFLQYQDQANELDVVSTRIYRLTQEIKWRGIYDATLPDGSSPGGSTLADMAKADDGEFLPHSQYQAIRDRGGIAAAFGFMPIDILSAVVAELSTRRAQLIEEIYQITGISDIVRGSTDPNETKGAQTLKAQFGGMRMNNRTREVQRFIRDAYRLIAEIVAEHFTQETLAEITQMDIPTAQEQAQLKQQIAMLQQPPVMPGAMAPAGVPAPAGPPPNAGPGTSPPAMQGQPMPGGAPPPAPAAPKIPPELEARANGPNWDDVMKILRSDKLRGYRVDIETDSTMEDQDAEKQRRIEAGAALMDGLEKAYVAATQAPKTLPLVKEILLFTMHTFHAGRSMEQAVEDAFDALEKDPPPPPQEPTQDIPPDLKAMEMQKKLLLLEQAQQVDAQHKTTTAQIDAQHKQGQLVIEKQRVDLEAAHKAEMARIEAEKVNHAKQAHADTMAVEGQKLQHAQAAQQQTAAIEQQKFAHTKETTAHDMGLRKAAHNKTMVSEMTATGEDQPNVLDNIMEGLSAVTQTVIAGQEQTAQKIDGIGQALQVMNSEIRAIEAAVGAVQEHAMAPTSIVRGPDGKAIGIQKGQMRQTIVRGPDGRATGLAH